MDPGRFVSFVKVLNLSIRIPYLYHGEGLAYPWTDRKGIQKVWGHSELITQLINSLFRHNNTRENKLAADTALLKLFSISSQAIYDLQLKSKSKEHSP